jgi:hypothetical protein
MIRAYINRDEVKIEILGSRVAAKVFSITGESSAWFLPCLYIFIERAMD